MAVSSRSIIPSNPNRDANMAFSPDCTMVAVPMRECDDEHRLRKYTVKLFDTESGKEMETLVSLEANQRVSSIAFSPDGCTLAIAISVFSTDSACDNICLFSKQAVSLITGCYIAPATACILWDLGTASARHTFGHQCLAHAGNFGYLHSTTFSPDGHMLATCYVGRRGATFICLWDTGSGERRAVMDVRGDARELVFSPDGRTLACFGCMNEWFLFDIASNKELLAKHEEQWVKSLAFTPDGRHVVLGLWWSRPAKLTIKMVEIATGKLVRTFSECRDPPCAIGFEADGTMVAMAEHGRIFYYTLAKRAPLRIAVFPDGEFGGGQFVFGNNMRIGASNCDYSSSYYEFRLWNLAPLSAVASRDSDVVSPSAPPPSPSVPATKRKTATTTTPKAAKKAAAPTPRSTTKKAAAATSKKPTAVVRKKRDTKKSHVAQSK